MEEGRLTVVGTGIGFRRQIIPAAETAIRQADLVFHQVGDQLTVQWLHQLNANVQSLSRPASAEPVLSMDVYEAMAHRVADAVAAGQRTCFVSYGHPGVYQHAAHRSIELTRARGFAATMIPGISALDCLIADLGVEIALGCQLLDATMMVLHDKVVDPTSALVLFQIGIFGDPHYRASRPVGLHVLRDRLSEIWGPEHEILLYEAPMLPIWDAGAERTTIADMATAPMSERTLAYVPPLAQRPMNALAAAAIASELAAPR
ncbi:SAM-dependent methyltransferase [Ilumatobacter sp.]|uniref:SAM-dependent methyltransferase n=1 Tax=Ilumatobacter sp. TaxID=1967498 RepID=UPI003AF4C105